jgi:hypothetical protein
LGVVSGMIKEPPITPSVLASIPDTLKESLVEVSRNSTGRNSILISSNSLANRFILARWGIRPSQRRRYKNLFATVRKQCRVIFQHYLLRGRVEWKDKEGSHLYGVYKFDELRGNLILGFKKMAPESE